MIKSCDKFWMLLAGYFISGAFAYHFGKIIFILIGLIFIEFGWIYNKYIENKVEAEE